MSRYSEDLMFTDMGKSRQPMSNDDLMRVAPSIFATAPDSEVTDRYHMVPTIEVVNGLRDAGWLPVEAKQVTVRKKANIEVAKHLIRFQNPDLPAVGDDHIIPELALRNAHDRTSGFNLMAALFRGLCSNGLYTAESMFGNIKARHTMKAVDQLIAGSIELAHSVPSIMSEVDRFKTIELTPTQQGVFARSALDFRYGVHAQQTGPEDRPEIIYGSSRDLRIAQRKAETEDDAKSIQYIPYKPEELLTARRKADGERQVLANGRVVTRAKNDLWTTYNVIQENLMKGGAKGQSANWRRSTSRGIKSIDEEVKLNKALWSMASYLAKYIEAA